MIVCFEKHVKICIKAELLHACIKCGDNEHCYKQKFKGKIQYSAMKELASSYSANHSHTPCVLCLSQENGNI